MTPEDILLAALFFAAALLYSSVGHAGASAYLAAMALVGLPVAVMRPTALVLNLFVASIVTFRFAIAGHLPWRSLVPLAIGSVPAAFIGGSIELPGEVFYRPAGGGRSPRGRRLEIGHLTATGRRREPPRRAIDTRASSAALAIGLLAGLTGTGGGHLPHAAACARRLDRHSRRCRPVGLVHPGELDRRAGRPAGSRG